jgi:hypothetical protein
MILVSLLFKYLVFNIVGFAVGILALAEGKVTTFVLLTDNLGAEMEKTTWRSFR